MYNLENRALSFFSSVSLPTALVHALLHQRVSHLFNCDHQSSYITKEVILDTFCLLMVAILNDVRGSPFFKPSSNSSTCLAISGPATIHLRSAPGFSVRPRAPPSPFTSALICSCAWSNEMAEKGRPVFLAVNAPRLNSQKTSGHLSCKDGISRT